MAKEGRSGRELLQFKKSYAARTFLQSRFIITWIFPTLTRLMQAITGSSPFWLILLMTIFLPMQGLINAMVFLRPKYQAYRKNNPNRTSFSIVRHAVFGKQANDSFVGSGSVIVTMFNRSSGPKSGISRFSSTGPDGDDEAAGNNIREGGGECEKGGKELNNNPTNTNGIKDEEAQPKRKHSSVQWADEEEKVEEG